MKYQSSSTAFNIMEQLVKKGFISKGAGPRMLQVIKQECVCKLCEENPGEIWMRNTKSGKRIFICQDCHSDVWGVDQRNGQGA
ncbi:hypothetical protein [Paenibacillus chibensis]|uniref:hypothetical protein n=1 Tax=Paenibacillus chibensis TaxID=59846 RepID=UPI000FD724D7|nr:hypothetical protein [Paenibacillus chibensis]MEC0372315.1 hypothetical protein [Paenibacillus chibensis]